MQDDNKRSEEEVVDNTDYITAIKELKENSVSKDKYDALIAERKQLIDQIVNGQGDIDQDDNAEPELGSRLDYYKKYKENKFPNNLEFWDNMVKLRKATIAEYGADPTVTGNYGLTPEGEKVEPAYGESEAMENAFNTIEEFIKQADGSPIVFDALMQSSVKYGK